MKLPRLDDEKEEQQQQECCQPLCWSHRYRVNGAVAANEEAVVVEAERTLNDPQNNSNPAVFIRIFFRGHLLPRIKKLLLPCCCRLC